MTPNHHPFPETLISFASGTLSNAVSAVVACHLSMCPVCAASMRRLEILGGLMLERLDGGPADAANAERALALQPPERTATVNEQTFAGKSDDEIFPPLLSRNLPISSAEIAWRPVDESVKRHRIALPEGAGQMWLLRLTPGAALSGRVGTAGFEVALVLQGALTDGHTTYIRGDILEWNEEAQHVPRATGDTDCICLIASDASAGAAVLPFQSLLEKSRKLFSPNGRMSQSWRSPAALAASLAMIAGIGLGWMLRVAPETSPVAGLIKGEGNRLLAQGALRNVLEAVPSGDEIGPADDQDLRLSVKMTFQDQDGDYCRQYDMSSGASIRYSGIACRKGGEWLVRIQALLPPATSAVQQTVPAAGANEAMDAVIGSWMSGDPVVGTAEEAIMRKGWKP